MLTAIVLLTLPRHSLLWFQESVFGALIWNRALATHQIRHRTTGSGNQGYGNLGWWRAKEQKGSLPKVPLLSQHQLFAACSLALRTVRGADSLERSCHGDPHVAQQY